MNKHYFAETEREIAAWPDTSITQENGGKHGRILLHYKGESRIVVVANTPSDARAIKNHIATVRRELRGMGASKTVQPPSQHQRTVNPFVCRDPPAQAAPIIEQPFAKLTGETMNNNAIDAIFASIEKLRYAEMLEFASILSDAANAGKMRRSVPNDWARTLQLAAENNRVPA